MGITGAVAFLKRIINLLSVPMTLQVHHCRYDFEVYLRYPIPHLSKRSKTVISVVLLASG